MNRNVTHPASNVTVQTFFKENLLPGFRDISNHLVMSREAPQNPLVLQPKECTNCKSTVNEQDSCYLIWEGMYFCDTMCLHWYQKQCLRGSCSNCFKLLSDDTIGKYVFRFDQLLQFCSIPCFHEYQTQRKSCLYCMDKIFSYSEVPHHYSRYCSLDCVVKHLKARGVTPFITQTPCSVCKTLIHPITIQYQLGKEVKNLCNQFCLQTLIFSHPLKLTQCSSCKTYFTPTSLTVKLTQGNIIFTFCSRKCETFYVFSNLRVFSCGYCNTKRFDTDLIKRCSRIEPLVYLCSLECYVKKYSATREQSFVRPAAIPKAPLKPIMENCEDIFKVSTVPDNDVAIKPEKDTNLSVYNTPTLVPNHVRTCFIIKSEPSHEQKNVATMCSVQKVDKSVCVKPKMVDQDIQTDPQPQKKCLIPIPVPIYVATPMHMFSVPVPNPIHFPLPIPIPIFIPTTRQSSKKIFYDINRMLDGTPNTAEEEDILAMAEAVGADSSTDLILSEQAVNTMFSDDMLQNANVDNNYDSEMQNLTDKQDDTKTETPCHVGSNLTLNVNPKIETNLLETPLGVHAWRQWVKGTKSFVLTDSNNVDMLKFSPKELGVCLALFVSEVKRPSGKKYAPDTVLYLCLSIQKYLFENNRVDNIFFDNCYKDFVQNLNEEMRTFPLLFLDSAYIVTRIEEEHLWESRQLGAHSPYILLNTILYHNMKYFRLMSLDENMTLVLKSIIKQIHQTDDTQTVLRCYRDNKEHFHDMPQNLDNFERCPLRLFEFYCSALSLSGTQPKQCYFEPIPTSVGNSSIWFSTKPLEKNDLEVMINRLKVVKELHIHIEMDN